MKFQVDNEMVSGKIEIKVLQTMIGRLETDKNPLNIMSVGKSRYVPCPIYYYQYSFIRVVGTSAKRKKLYDVLENIESEEKGFLNYKEYMKFVQQPVSESESDDSTRCRSVFSSIPLILFAGRLSWWST